MLKSVKLNSLSRHFVRICPRDIEDLNFINSTSDRSVRDGSRYGTVTTGVQPHRCSHTDSWSVSHSVLTLTYGEEESVRMCTYPYLIQSSPSATTTTTTTTSILPGTDFQIFKLCQLITNTSIGNIKRLLTRCCICSWRWMCSSGWREKNCVD